MPAQFTPRSIKYLLGKHKIARILDKTVVLRQLNHVLSMCLEPNIQAHCQAANWRDGELILQVTNSALATTMRYQIPELSKSLRTHPEFKQLKKIRIRVSKPTPKANEKPTYPKPTPINTKNRELLKETAKHLSDPELKKAINNLAKR